MEASDSVHERRRSPSAHLYHSHAAADPSLASSAFDDSNYTTFPSDYQQQTLFSLGPTYTDFQQEQDKQLMSQSSQSFLHSQDSSQYSSQGGSQLSNGINESSAFPSLDFTLTNGYDQAGSLDPTLLDTLNSNTLDPKSADPMASALSSHSPTPPHLVPDMASRRHSGSPSPHASPNFQHAAPFPNMDGRPRNLSESLDPSSALFPQGHQGSEWSAMGAYRGAHRRTPSDNYSDVSSTHNSPYMANLDSFDAHASPMLNSTADPSFGSDLGMQTFTLNDNNSTNQQSFHGHSPGHSPQPSPRLAAQQQVPDPFTNDNSYNLNLSMNRQFVPPQQNGLEMYSGGGQEQFPSLNGHPSPSGDIGLADQMSPPEINIDFAPPSRDPVEQFRSVNGGEDTLSPPMRSNRTRSKSDSQAGARPMSPNFIRRGRSPSLQEQQSVSLSPFDNNVPSTSTSRSQSPARVRNGSIGSRNRSHSASDNRDYILDLIDPGRSPSNAPSGRVQRHPANFQCNLCPKRFTRAYNLRSHLRTHTDERPFVCTVCGKAFARQHDRKRHEGLHSGEKKFVCRGTLQSGPQWGCGRRFARADALGRHFRSEAGRVCIKPLLDEEAAERQKAWMQDQQNSQMAQNGMGSQPLLNPQPQLDAMNGFPQALLQQYPALAGLDWTTIPQGPPPDEGDFSGRSSFDASSGGEYYDDLSENEMSTAAYADPQQMNNMNGMNMAMAQQQMNGMAQQPFSASGYNGSQTVDYLSDFEGR